jgi:hypothetical protein
MHGGQFFEHEELPAFLFPACLALEPEARMLCGCVRDVVEYNSWCITQVIRQRFG